MKWSKKIAMHFIKHGIITREQIDWFIYGIEKRMASACMFPPFFLIALLWTTPLCATSLFASFYLLRRRISGYHADSMGACMCISLILEMLFLGLVYPAPTEIHILLVIGICLPVIIALAPYNHPNMNWNDEELSACRISARNNAYVLSIASVISYFIGLHEIAKGLSTGITMATFLLYIAYLIEWRNKND